MSVIDRFEQRKAQAAYERSIASQGLEAAIAPYMGVLAPVSVPKPRTAPSEQRELVDSGSR